MLAAIVQSLTKSVFLGRVRYASPSLELCEEEAVACVLGEAPTLCLPFQPMKSETYVGWGQKSGRYAKRMAQNRNARMLLLEDGFLRSYNRHDRTLAIALDDLGIYYDAYAPSRLETLIPTILNKDEEKRISAILSRWKELRLSKYNAGSEYEGPLPDDYVLVIDQVRNDASIHFGMADAQSFQTMLETACKENPNSQILVKMHPDIYTRSKSGHYDVSELSSRKNIKAIAQGCLPSRLIENAKKIYTVTSQIGFEALIWEKPVRCFGMPFYAGWGLTEDFLPAPKRRQTVSFTQLAMASLVFYPRYLNLRSGGICEIERAIDYLAELKQKF